MLQKLLYICNMNKMKVQTNLKIKIKFVFVYKKKNIYIQVVNSINPSKCNCMMRQKVVCKYEEIRKLVTIKRDI